MVARTDAGRGPLKGRGGEGQQHKWHPLTNELNLIEITCPGKCAPSSFFFSPFFLEI